MGWLGEKCATGGRDRERERVNKSAIPLTTSSEVVQGARFNTLYILLSGTLFRAVRHSSLRLTLCYQDLRSDFFGNAKTLETKLNTQFYQPKHIMVTGNKIPVINYKKTYNYKNLT